jgi:hypothetical protein
MGVEVATGAGVDSLAYLRAEDGHLEGSHFCYRWTDSLVSPGGLKMMIRVGLTAGALAISGQLRRRIFKAPTTATALVLG